MTAASAKTPSTRWQAAQALVGRHAVDPARLAAYRSVSTGSCLAWAVAALFVARDSVVPDEGMRAALVLVAAGLGVLQLATAYALYMSSFRAVELTPGGFRYVTDEASIYVPFSAIAAARLGRWRADLIISVTAAGAPWSYRLPWWLPVNRALYAACAEAGVETR